MVRHIRLVSRPGTQDAAEEQRWLASRGLSMETLPKRATWYRADGLAIPNLPTDPYHRALYRGKGWTLKPPADVGIPSVERAPQATQPADITPGRPVAPKPLRMSRLSRAVLRVMEGRDSWEGTATELMTLVDPHAPPGGRHYRVIGMPLNPARLSREIMAPMEHPITEACSIPAASMNWIVLLA